jgi:hypothetical protein
MRWPRDVLVIAFLVTAAGWVGPSQAAFADTRAPQDPVAGSATDGGFLVASNQRGVHIGSDKGNGLGETPAPPPTLVVDCGVSPSKSSLPECRRVATDCTALAAAAPAGTVITAIVTYNQTASGLVFVNGACQPRTAAPPGLSEADVRAQVVRLVPRAGVRAAPSGSALVQLESLFWVDTAATRDLGTVELAGHQVAITVRVSSVRWDFGDGTSDSNNGPGRPFTQDSHCGQKQCPGWFGHTYEKTGTVTVTARVNWSATYAVDGGPAQLIGGTVDAAPETMTVVVKQARAVLVPNPTK